MSNKKGLSVKADRLELAKAISNLTTKEDAFMKAVDALQNFKEDGLKRLELDMESRKLDLEELKQNIEHIKKNGQIEVDQFIKEYKYDGARKILDDRDEIPIEMDELTRMNDELKKLKMDRSEEMDDIKNKQKDKAKKALTCALNNSELKHKAEIAELKAQNNMSKHEITTLQKTIENLRDEIAEQRKLTKEVAEASRQNVSFAAPTQTDRRYNN